MDLAPELPTESNVDTQYPPPLDTKVPRIEPATFDRPARDLFVLHLHKGGLTQTAIAHRVGMSQANVSRILASYTPTKELAKLRADNAALRLVDRVLEKADVEESLEILDRIGVLEKRHPEVTQSHVAIAVVNMPGQQAFTADMIDVSPGELKPLGESL